MLQAKHQRRPLAHRRLRFEALEDRALMAALLVNHPPYLQLGNAPLPGLVGSASDQVALLWQTKPAAVAGNDTFDIDYRQQGAAGWTAAGAASTINTGVEGRVEYSVTLVGLAYDRNYEYRVIHRRDGTALETFQKTFHTRLAPGVDDVFSFVAYGDSTIGNPPTGMIGVQNRINTLSPAFSLLLGDNAYNAGSHAEFDARFDPAINPSTPAFAATHVEYATLGNHDIGTAAGQPSRDNYAVPLIQQGVTSTVAPPVGETAESDYSWHYGNVHFATLDSNSWNDSARLARQLTWLSADLAASHARWKVVYLHHPLASLADHTEMNAATNYCATLLPALRAAGVDLLLTGHAHDYQRSFPLLSTNGSTLDYVSDTDNQYAKGAGLVQVIAGVGGASIRPAQAVIPPNSFNARTMTADSTPAARFGTMRVSVSPRALTVTYVAADDGSVLDRFTIVDTSMPIVADAPGLYDPNTSLFYLRNTPTSGIADTTFGFGAPGAGWQPLSGDWNGDGADSVGLFDPHTLLFYLRNTNTSGAADATFGYGDPSQREQYVPLVGDWDGDGVDTIGLYHKVSASWWLCNTRGGGFADTVFGFGPPGANWQPRVGDWDGDGIDTIGLFDPSTSLLYVRNSNNGGYAQAVYTLNAPSPASRMVIGDWNSNRTATVGFYEPSTAQWRLHNTNDQPAPDVTIAFGAPGAAWQPLTGKWTAPVGAIKGPEPLAPVLEAKTDGPLDAVADEIEAGQLGPVLGEFLVA